MEDFSFHGEMIEVETVVFILCLKLINTKDISGGTKNNCIVFLEGGGGEYFVGKGEVSSEYTPYTTTSISFHSIDMLSVKKM